MFLASPLCFRLNWNPRTLNTKQGVLPISETNANARQSAITSVEISLEKDKDRTKGKEDSIEEKGSRSPSNLKGRAFTLDVKPSHHHMSRSAYEINTSSFGGSTTPDDDGEENGSGKSGGLKIVFGGGKE